MIEAMIKKGPETFMDAIRGVQKHVKRIKEQAEADHRKMTADAIAENVVELYEELATRFLLMGMPPEVQRIYFASVAGGIMEVKGGVLIIKKAEVEDVEAQVDAAEGADEDCECETCDEGSCPLRSSKG